MEISSKRIYEVKVNTESFWILILYDISKYHFVGLKVLSGPNKNTVRLDSIDKYVDLYGIKEYKYSMIKKPVYVKGKVLEINDVELSILFQRCKESIINYLKYNASANTDGVTYLKWCKDKFILNTNEKGFSKELKQHAIYWINMGYGVGSEIRKIRPAILWRKSANGQMLTVIPLTSKNHDDSYYFHYDIESCADCTAKIEYMQNLSYKRILSPYYKDNKLCFITKDDKNNIINIIERYYLFK